MRVTEKRKLIAAGRVAVDSGAADSVMPKGMLAEEILIDGAAKLAGVKYVAANGARIDSYGEKNVKFRCGPEEMMNKITLHVTDVGKPLASVSRILDKGNTVVFSRREGGSYILNEKTGGKIALKEEEGTFGLDVEYYQPEASTGETSGLTRQGP